jgi:hypothetical protein
MPKSITRTDPKPKNLSESKPLRAMKLGQRTEGLDMTTEQMPQRPRNFEELEAFKKVKQVLMSRIDIDEREWTGPGRVATHRFVQVGGKLPPDLVDKIKVLGGRFMHHVERSLKLYLLVLNEGQENEA